MIAVNNEGLDDVYNEKHQYVSLSAESITLFVFNNPAAITVFKKNPGGGLDYEQMPEQAILPGTVTIQNAVGLKLRNYVAGQTARIYLIIPEFDPKSPDPVLVGYTPTTLTITAAGSLGSVGVIDRVIAPNDINGVNTEQTLYSFNFTAGQIAPSGIVELKLGGDFLHNNVAGDTLRIRVKLGLSSGALTAIYDDTDTLGGSLSAIRHPWDLYIRLQNLGDAKRQSWQGNINLDPSTGTAPTTGLGNLNQAPGTWKNPPIGLGPGAYVFDTTQPVTLAVTVQWSAASGNNSFAVRNGYLTNN